MAAICQAYSFGKFEEALLEDKRHSFYGIEVKLALIRCMLFHTTASRVNHGKLGKAAETECTEEDFFRAKTWGFLFF